MIPFVKSDTKRYKRWHRRSPLNSPLNPSVESSLREDFSEYVAHLQFHMTLQARNLVPTLGSNPSRPADSREQLLQKTQADFEKIVSRQAS